jgi:hypothetical protein
MGIKSKYGNVYVGVWDEIWGRTRTKMDIKSSFIMIDVSQSASEQHSEKERRI